MKVLTEDGHAERIACIDGGNDKQAVSDIQDLLKVHNGAHNENER